MSILIVEDDKTSARVIEIVLKKYGYLYHHSENGKLALDHLLVNPQVKLVISDIMMPEMDGLELLSIMRKTREFQNTPVIMCTTKADLDTVKQAVKTGCGDYIIKPINPLQLLRKIEQVLEKQTPVLMEYRDLVLDTRMDRYAYSEMIKAFAPLLKEKLELLEEYLNEKQPLSEEYMEGFIQKCQELGATRLHHLLVNSGDLLCQKTGSLEDVYAELRLLRREMRLLESTLP